MEYKEEQIGWIINSSLLFVIFFMLTLYLLEIGKQPMPLFILLIFILLFFIILLLFYKLSVTVNKQEIVVSFGIGLIRKKVKLENIKSVKKVKNKWYNGYGIRYIRNGWLYNIQGFSAIELSFKDRNSVFRIGTKDNSRLLTEINNRLKKTN